MGRAALWVGLGERTRGGGDLAAWGPHPPQGLSDHVLICDPVVSEGLIPRGIQSVSQSFCSKLICLGKGKMILLAQLGRIMAPKAGYNLVPGTCTYPI
jgi:hypothetical protein